ncbi:hypothetical protein B0H13DRAFT_709528 [Mycena leptocephala]|nr:hypothetical protein B0H13DRAFT_709528 [Mycena leptocephala]
MAALSGRNGGANLHFVNSAEDSHEANLADIVNKIPSKPSLKKSCEKCRKRPDQDGKGFSFCASCKVSCYCSRECQTSHWKEHKGMCKTRMEHAEIEQDLKAHAALSGGFFVSQATLRKWYYDNVAIVDYAIVQTLELYKGRTHDLWRTHAVVFALSAETTETCVSSSEKISFSDAEPVPITTLAREDHFAVSPKYLRILGLGSRIIILFIVNGESNLMLIDSHDLPLDEEWDRMEKDETWMFARGKPIADVA